MNYKKKIVLLLSKQSQDVNKIELLTADLLDDPEKLVELDHWLRVMNSPQGWHYDLDILWLLKGLEKAGIQKGDTILDAGSGMGITQFLLASRGFNIISLDSSPRFAPLLAKGIFEIELANQNNLSYHHDYMDFVNHEVNPHAIQLNYLAFLQRILGAFKKGPRYFLSRIKVRIRQHENLKINKMERQRSHEHFGIIKFVQASFHDIPLENEAVDALISVSALEHSEQRLHIDSINEMKRVVKNSRPLFITTSATTRDKDWFDKKTLGWCFTEKSLKKMALLETETESEFDATAAEKCIINSELWKSRIGDYYANDPSSVFYRRQVNHLPYLPVGITIYNV